MILYLAIIFGKICQYVGLNQETLDVQSNALLSELSRHVAVTYVSLYDTDMIIRILQNIL